MSTSGFGVGDPIEKLCRGWMLLDSHRMSGALGEEVEKKNTTREFIVYLSTKDSEWEVVKISVNSPLKTLLWRSPKYKARSCSLGTAQLSAH